MLINKDNEISENKQDNQTAVNIFSETFVTIVWSVFVALQAVLPSHFWLHLDVAKSSDLAFMRQMRTIINIPLLNNSPITDQWPV